MKKMLYIPQFSMSDGKTAFIEKDGAFTTLKIFLKFLRMRLREFPDEAYAIKALLPPSESVSATSLEVFEKDISSIVNSTDGKLDVSYSMTSQYTLSPIQDRYNFEMDKWVKRLENEDVIINNIPEISRNIRAALGSKKAKLISFHHFPDYVHENKLVATWENGDKFSYFWRQFDACLASDLNVFNCKASLRGWVESINWALGPNVSWIGRSDKFITLPYTDLTDYAAFSDKTIHISPKFEITTAVFPARITESLYTNWQKVFELFSDSRTAGRVIICNPSGNKGIEVLRKLGYLQDFTLSYIEVDRKRIEGFISRNEKIFVTLGLTNFQYQRICQKAQIGISLYEHERYGGIAIREVIGQSGGIPICLNRNECANWYHDVLSNTELNDLSDLTFKTYNGMVEMLGSPAHAKILDNFKNTEHYIKYYPNFEKLLGVINAD